MSTKQQPNVLLDQITQISKQLDTLRFMVEHEQLHSSGYNDEEVDAALCVWEWMLDQRATHVELRRAWDDCGSASMRSECVQLGRTVEQIYQLIDEELRGTYLFDWEVVPAIMAQAVFLTEGGYVVLPEPDVAARKTVTTLEGHRRARK
jgi:hypothetical protein